MYQLPCQPSQPPAHADGSSPSDGGLPRSCPHYTGSTLHTHPHAHKTGHRSLLHWNLLPPCHEPQILHITFPYCRIRKHSSLISHIDELSGFLIIGNTHNSYRCNHTTVLLPLLIQNIRHIFAKFPPFGCNKEIRIPSADI